MATSIKALETKVEAEILDLQARVEAPSSGDNPGPAMPMDTPLRGASVDPPPTPSVTRFQLPGGMLNPYWDSASFTPGNCHPHAMAPPHDKGHIPHKHEQVATPVFPLHRNPLAGDLREQPTPVTPQEGPTTPAQYDTHEDGTKDQIVGGPVKSP